MNNQFLDTQNLSDYKVYATDGELGKVKDFYFDEEQFFLRYFVVDTNKFFFTNLVLISPISLKKIDTEKKEIFLTITKEQMENAPSVESIETLSEQFEREYNSFFGWPNYWETEPLAAWSIGPYALPWRYIKENNMARNLGTDPQTTTVDDLRNREKSRLRSANEIETYQIQSKDGVFGHIQGYLVNSKTMAVEFFIIDTINNFPSKLVVARPEWIKNISWLNKMVEFPFSEELVKTAPAYREDVDQKDLVEGSEKHFRTHLDRIKIERSHDYHSTDLF